MSTARRPGKRQGVAGSQLRTGAEAGRHAAVLRSRRFARDVPLHLSNRWHDDSRHE
jgi:hypothetical protein